MKGSPDFPGAQAQPTRPHAAHGRTVLPSPPLVWPRAAAPVPPPSVREATSRPAKRSVGVAPPPPALQAKALSSPVRSSAPHVQAALGAVQAKPKLPVLAASPHTSVAQPMKRTSSMSSGGSSLTQEILWVAQQCGQDVLSQVGDILQSRKLRNPAGLLALLKQIESTGDPGFRYELYYAWRQVTKPGKAHEIQLGAVGGIGGDVVVFRGDRGKRDKTLQIKYVTGTGKKAFKGNLLAAAAQLGSETGNDELASPDTIRTVEMVLENPNLPEAKLSDEELANRLGEYLGPSPKIQYVDRVRLRINNPQGGHRVVTFSRY